MKPGLVPAIVVAVLLLGFLLYWKARPPEGATPGSHFEAKAVPPESSVVQLDDAAGPEETARSEAAPATIASPVLEGDLASSGAPGAATVATVMTLIPEKQQERKKDDEVGNEVFEWKYAGMSADARREALESLRVLLERDREAGLGEGRPLTETQSQDLKREIEWLMEHELP